jgi:hypothetical protein
MLQPGAFVANYEPAAYRAVLLRDQRNITELTRTLRLLPTHIIEGWLLLGEKDRLATFRERNPAGYRQAERTLRAAGEGRWLGVPHPRN